MNPTEYPRHIAPTLLVPRTRSSHHNCRESDCELRVQSGTRIIDLLVSYDSEVRIEGAARAGELRNRDTGVAPAAGKTIMPGTNSFKFVLLPPQSDITRDWGK